jgi:hypothetical protein
MPHGPTQFRSTVVKPYYRDDTPESPQETPDDTLREDDDQYAPEDDDDPTIVVDVQQLRRGRGRPKGLRNR